MKARRASTRRKRMETSMLKFLPLIMRGRSYFWPNMMVDSLKTLSKGPEWSQVDSGKTLFDFIMHARQEIGLEKENLQRNSGKGYSLFFDDFMSLVDAKQWFEDTLPSLAKLLLRFPIILENHYAESNENSAASVDTCLRILHPQQPGIVLLSQELVAALLACALLCLFPVDQRWKNKLPKINFDGLFAGLCMDSESQRQKIRCLVNYFQRISGELPAGAVSFERKVIPLKGDTFPFILSSGDFWSQSKEPLCAFEVSGSGGIEDHCREALEVDFANEYLGGGALTTGCVQEEIRFMINSELIAGMLFLPCMEDNESIEVVGAERFSNYEGYASGFRFAGNFIDHKPRDNFGRLETRIVAIDALRYPGEKQFECGKICREVNKAFCGFLDHAQLRGYFNFIKAAKMKHRLSNDTNASRTVDESTLMQGTDFQVQDQRNFDSMDETIEPINKVKDDKGKDIEQICCLHIPADGIGISTGNWGCGAFGGDVELKSMLQWIAASKALRPFVLYFAFGGQFAGRLQRVTEGIKSHSWTLGELWDTLLEYSRQRLTGKANGNFFDWLLPLIRGGLRAETELKTKELLEQVSELESKLNDSMSREMQLEADLQILRQKEKEMSDLLREEREKTAGMEAMLQNSTEKQHGLHDLADSRRASVKEKEERIVVFQSDLNDAACRESEFKPMLAGAEVPLREKGKCLESELARAVELESRIPELAAKLQEAENKLMQKMSRSSAADASTSDSERQISVSKLWEMENKLERVQKEYEVAIAKAEKLNAETETLAESNVKLTEELSSLQSHVGKFQAAYEQAENERQAVSEQLVLSEKSLAELRERLAQEKSLYESQLKGGLKNRDIELMDRDKIVEKLERQILQANSPFQDTDEWLKAYREEENDYKSEFNTFKEKLNQHALAERELQEKLQLCLAQLKESEERESNLKNELEKVKASDEMALTSANQELREKLQHTENRVQEQMNANAEKMKRAAKQIESLQSQHERENSKRKLPLETERGIDANLLVRADKKSTDTERRSQVGYSTVSDAAVSQSFQLPESLPFNLRLVAAIAVFAVFVGIIIVKRY